MLSHVRLFVSPWTVACEAPLPIEFSRQEFWCGLPFHSPGDPPDPRIEPTTLESPALAGRLFTISTTCCSVLNSFSHVLLFATLWTITHSQHHMDLQSAPLDHMNHSQPYGPQ